MGWDVVLEQNESAVSRSAGSAINKLIDVLSEV
jgi:hypothetical protein